MLPDPDSRSDNGGNRGGAAARHETRTRNACPARLPSNRAAVREDFDVATGSVQRALGVVVLTAVVTAMLGVAVVALLPPIWVAATTLVAEEDMTTTIRGERVEASVPVPAGWAMRPTFADESRVTLTSPDGRMQVDLAVRDAGDPVVTLGDIAPRPLDALSRERTVAGQELLHANTADGELIVGVVVSGDALLTFVSGPRQGYDAELAELLAEIDVSQIGVTG